MKQIFLWSSVFFFMGCSEYDLFSKKEESTVPNDEIQAPAIIASPDPVQFGTLSDTTPQDQVLLIENVGTSDLHINQLNIVDPQSSLVFDVILIDSDIIAPNSISTAIVTYSPPQNNASHQAFLDIDSNDPDRPTITITLLAAIEFSEMDTGDAIIEEDSCDCPDGSTPNDSDTACLQETFTEATPTGEVVEVCPIEPFWPYGKFGVKYSGGLNIRDAYWGQDDSLPNGRLNETGVWGCDSNGVAGSQPTHAWIGFGVCLNITQDGDYLLGLGADNRMRFSVDGVTILEDIDDDTSNFNYWWMFSVSLTAGTHIINVEGYNAGSQAAFGAELAGPFPSGTLVDDESMSEADYANNIVWATQDAIGQAFPIGDGVNWECPDGSELQGCDEPICVTIEEIPCE